MKRCFFFALILALLIGTLACSPSSDYRDDLGADELAKALTDALGDTVYLEDDTDMTADYFALPDSVSDYAVRYAKDTGNINEIGVYHVGNGDADALKKLLAEQYLTPAYRANREWYDSYIPQETPKLRDAEVRVLGSYVIYTILSPADRATVYRVAEEMLIEK